MARFPLRRWAAAAAVVVLSLTGCSTGTSGSAGTEAGPTSAAADQFPVTIKHAFGETTLEKQPARVATISWVNADVSLALGVVPVGMAKDAWGQNEKDSTPWKDAKLEELGAALGTDKAPVQYDETDGIAFDEIAKLSPDVILAAYSGITQEDYDTLSKIAPVVAYPDAPWVTSWQDSATMIGEALGKSEEAKDLVADTEKLIADQAAKYPQLKGKTFIYGNLEPASADGVNVYTAGDNRPKFLTSLGMVQAPIVEANAPADGFYLPWSAEKANELDSEIFVTWVPEASTKEQIAADPLLGQIPAVKNGALVADPSQTLTLAISAASALSLPWALDEFLPQLATAADVVDKK